MFSKYFPIRLVYYNICTAKLINDLRFNHKSLAGAHIMKFSYNFTTNMTEKDTYLKLDI